MKKKRMKEEACKNAKVKDRSQKPSNYWVAVFSGAIHDLLSHGWLPNLLIGLALLLIWPFIGAAVMNSRQATIVGFGIGVTLLVWIGVIVLLRQAPKPIETELH